MCVCANMYSCVMVKPFTIKDTLTKLLKTDWEGPGEMAQKLRALTDLPEAPCLSPSTYMVAPNLCNSRRHCMYMIHRLICRRNTHSCAIKTNESLKSKADRRLEGWLNGKEHLLFFQKTWALVPVPTSGNLSQCVTPAPGELMSSSGFCEHCIHMHKDTKARI